jgi:hypothetical protein
MKYLRLFETDADYQSFIGGGGTDYVTPNVCLVRGNDYCHYQPYIPIPISVGDIAYWDGSSVKTTPLSSWNTSLGTPVGVVMIGEGFAPDGRARIIALDLMKNMILQIKKKELPIPTFDYLITTDNVGSTTNGFDEFGSLPSDIFEDYGIQSFVDNKSYYPDLGISMIPSPYLGDTPNPAYYQEIEGGNAFSDFNGLSNTQLLVNDGTNYQAAQACWNYKDATNGADGLQWYLPAMGELGYLMPRFNLINESIQAVGGAGIDDCDIYSSSGCFTNQSYIFWSLGQYYVCYTGGGNDGDNTIPITIL